MKKNITKRKIVVIGGGTGTFTVLSGLKKYPNLEVSVIVSMMDDGGSNRVIRDEFGLLPTSDIRQCIVALASDESNETLRKLFTYRYESGVGISGMTFGNLFMAALTDIYKGDQKRAIEETCEILGVKGNVIPVTFDKVNLIAKYANGEEILGQHNIVEPTGNQGEYKILNLKVFPKATENPEVVNVLKKADLVILGPGDLYTSILANVVIGKVSDHICKSRAKKVFVANLMSKYGETYKYKTSDLVNEIQKYIGCSLDYVIVNDNTNFLKKQLSKYKDEKSEIIPDDLVSTNSFKVIRADLVSHEIFIKTGSDKLKRSFIRHDPDKLARAILDI